MSSAVNAHHAKDFPLLAHLTSPKMQKHANPKGLHTFGKGLSGPNFSGGYPITNKKPSPEQLNSSNPPSGGPMVIGGGGGGEGGGGGTTGWTGCWGLRWLECRTGRHFYNNHVVVLQGLLERSTLHVEVGVTVRTQHPTERFVVLSDSPCHYSSNATNAEVSSVIRSLVSDRPIMTTAVATTVVVAASFVMVPRAGDEPVYASIFTDSTSAGTDMDSETLRPIYVPKWNMVNEFSFDDPDVCRSLVDQLSPHVLFSQLCGMDYGQLFAEFNVRAARQTCLGAEVRIQTEQILREKRKLKGRCSRQADLLKVRDVEIASLKAQLS
ncbi:hypothetical protein Tco_0939099 [Tanacetum coccineum]|uniref:Uncharacterized protein n=1 Tax=Tanacetum coccineum TaxID=301880 RepID=A0ABQ5DR00_9ASTR